ncbi:hypothetical protein PFISCL1PPCAC_1204, partial [Pristionchus fissidentatus]
MINWTPLTFHIGNSLEQLDCVESMTEDAQNLKNHLSDKKAQILQKYSREDDEVEDGKPDSTTDEHVVAIFTKNHFENKQHHCDRNSYYVHGEQRFCSFSHYCLVVVFGGELLLCALREEREMKG